VFYPLFALMTVHIHQRHRLVSFHAKWLPWMQASLHVMRPLQGSSQTRMLSNA